jgi:hypothetical protein
MKKKIILLFLPIFFIAFSCKKQIVQDHVYDNIIYDVGDKVVYQSASQKTRQKTPTQFISILYSDLFQTAIPNNQLNDLSVLFLANGDKNMITEMLVSDYMNTSGVKLPSNSAMRADLDKFIDNTYIHFYLRYPTSYEKYFLKNLIQNDVNVTPELVYSSFVLSDEYWFY